jgi:isopenicillin-N epimerase
VSSRRAFLASIGVPAAAALGGVSLSPLLLDRSRALARELATHAAPPEEMARDEAVWAEVARAFSVDRSLVNLNNGGVSPSPTWVQDAMKQHLDYSNKAPAYTMWQVLEPQRETVRDRMAREWGVDPEEVAFTRNASEGLQICQLGIDLQRGDEILTTTQDYGRMITTFNQRERREGVVLRQVQIPTPAEDPAEVVRIFEEAITPRTRMILVCHMINLTGQILPVREITALGRRHGIPVIVDGAHALAHNHFSLGELDVDYYATSLHKWLFAPHGTGLLYVRRERIRDLWPLMAAPESMDDNIRKFEEIGTHPAANTLAIGEALTFHQGLGGERKAARLVHLRNVWANRLTNVSPRVRLHTSMKDGLACGLATVQVEGVDTGALGAHLWGEHRILATPIRHAEFEGLRVTPSVYTTLEELERFSEVMERVIRHGLPA